MRRYGDAPGLAEQRDPRGVAAEGGEPRQRVGPAVAVGGVGLEQAERERYDQEREQIRE